MLSSVQVLRYIELISLNLIPLWKKKGRKNCIDWLNQLPMKLKNASRPNSDTLFKDEVTTAQKYIDELKQQGIDGIIVPVSLGLSRRKELATQLSGIDVIVGGDSHTFIG